MADGDSDQGWAGQSTEGVRTEHLEGLPDWLFVENTTTRMWVITVLNTLHVLYTQAHEYGCEMERRDMPGTLTIGSCWSPRGEC